MINQIWLSIFAYNLNINPIQDGGDKKAPPTSFPPVTSTNIRISPQNFLTFSFNLFATLIQNFKFVPSTSPKLLNLNQNHLKKKNIFADIIKTLTMFIVTIFKRMVCLKYLIILISKLDSGLSVCPGNVFSYKKYFLIWGIQQVLFFLYTFLFSFHKKPCSQFSCVCVTSMLIIEKNNMLTFFS